MYLAQIARFFMDCNFLRRRDRIVVRDEPRHENLSRFLLALLRGRLSLLLAIEHGHVVVIRVRLCRAFFLGRARLRVKRKSILQIDLRIS